MASIFCFRLHGIFPIPRRTVFAMQRQVTLICRLVVQTSKLDTPAQHENKLEKSPEKILGKQASLTTRLLSSLA